jgi:membrane protein implicated in regulation of membrane protease activity
VSLEFLSGLLLVLALLGALVYILKELLSGSRLDLSAVNLSDVLARQRQAAPKPINEHLIGMVGEVVRHTDDNERPMKVRLGSELWPALPESTAAGLPPVGARISVTTVDGPIVIVRRVEETDSPQ